MLNLKNFVLVYFFLFEFNILQAQLDTIWTKTLGGTLNEVNGLTLPNNLGSPGASISKYGNFIFAVSSSQSNDGDLLFNYGSEDIYVIKLNLQGDTLWTKSFGGNDFERAYKVLALNDGGCVIAGSTLSNSNDFANSKGSSDGFLLRLDENGALVWFKRYGGSDADYLYDVILTSDGNFLAVGESISSNGDLQGTGSGISWVIKINPSNGNRIWSKTYLGPDSNSQDYLDNFFRVMELSDGSGFIAAGYTSPNFNDAASDDIHYEKIDNNGNVIWSKKVGSNGGDAIGNIVDAGNGEFYLIGRLMGTGSIINSYYGGNGDVWIVKCNTQGNVLWNKNYGGTNWEFAFDAKKDSLNNIYIGAFTRSTDNDATGVNFGLQDFWILKTDSSGNLLWKYRCGGSLNEVILGIEVLNINSVVAIGRSFSNDGFLQLNNGGSDLWIVRVDSSQSTTTRAPHSFQNESNVYLIPLNDQNYQLKSQYLIHHVQIFDLQGKLLYDKNLNEYQTQFEWVFPKGIYIMTLQTENQTIVKKFYH